MVSWGKRLTTTVRKKQHHIAFLRMMYISVTFKDGAERDSNCTDKKHIPKTLHCLPRSLTNCKFEWWRQSLRFGRWNWSILPDSNYRYGSHRCAFGSIKYLFGIPVNRTRGRAPGWFLKCPSVEVRNGAVQTSKGFQNRLCVFTCFALLRTRSDSHVSHPRKRRMDFTPSVDSITSRFQRKWCSWLPC